jgi:tRNA nucleotidyltransferase (CCA-adding enzyme)
MDGLRMNTVPAKIVSIAEAVSSAGGRAMLIGGCVRDEIMGIEHKDWDIEVYGVRPDKLREILDSFGDINVVGEAFTVYKIGNDLDVSIPRRERKVGKGHRGFVVEGDPEMSFEEACARRDFTINAILKDPLTGEIVDPFDGRADIGRKVLRHISSGTFGDDSLRVLRAAQFAARFEFDIHARTIEICRAIDVTDLPKERVWGEIEKLLLKAKRPSIGIRWLYELGVVRQLFPELQALVGVPQESEWHPEGDVDVHTMMVVDEARKLIDHLDHPRQVAVMLGSLAHDFGKPSTTQFIDGRMRSHGHDEAGVEPTLSFLDTLGIFTLDGYDVRNQVVQLVKYHLKPGEYYKAKSPVGDGAFRRLARKVEPDLLYRVAKADSLGRNPDWLPKEKRFDSAAQEWFIEKVRELAIEKKAPDPILMGRHLIDLGLEPSPVFKKMLDAVYELQLDGRITTVEQAIAAAKEMMSS